MAPDVILKAVAIGWEDFKLSGPTVLNHTQVQKKKTTEPYRNDLKHSC